MVSLFSDYNHPSIMEWQREMARRYRMIVLSLNVLKPFAQREPNPQDRYPRYLEVMRDLDVARLDAALRHVLPKFPIDPDRIALFSQAMGEAFHVGRNNTDIFSRIAERDGYLSVWTKTMAESSARNPEALFFVLGQPGEFHMSLPAVQGLRNDGYTVTVGLTRREHGHRMEDYDVIYRWFRDSWAAPAMAAPVSEPVPLLTAGAIAASAAFWAGFAREPDSVRQSHRKDLTVLVGSEPMPVRVTDLTAVAAEYPSVSRALRAVGLTAPEAESYWRAIIGVAAVWKANRQRPVVAVEAGSAVARNIALLNARPDEFAILRRF